MAENIDMLEKAIRRQNAIMHQIELYCGDEGMDTEDQDRYREAKSKKSGFQAELASLKARIAKKREPISENEVLAILGDFDSLLVEAGSGILDLDAKQRAAALIRDLVGGVVKVSFTRLGGRRAFGLGTFTPHPALAIAKRLGLADSTMPNPQPVTVSFRDLPRYANIVDEVYRLYTEEGLSFNAIGKQLGCGSGNAWYAYAHWHISRNLPVPRQRRQAREKIRHEEKSA